MLTSKGSDTGNLTMHGLPFTSSNLSGGYTVLASWHTSMEIPGYKNIQCYVDSNRHGNPYSAEKATVKSSHKSQ